MLLCIIFRVDRHKKKVQSAQSSAGAPKPATVIAANPVPPARPSGYHVQTAHAIPMFISAPENTMFYSTRPAPATPSPQFLLPKSPVASTSIAPSPAPTPSLTPSTIRRRELTWDKPRAKRICKSCQKPFDGKLGCDMYFSGIRYYIVSVTCFALTFT